MSASIINEIIRRPISIARVCYGLLFRGDAACQFGNSAALIGMRAISGFTRLGILLGIARVYGPESFGKLSASIAVVEILRMFSDFGIDTISIRKFTQAAPEARAQLLEGILGTKLLLGACFYSLGAILLFVLSNDHSEVPLGLVAGLSIFFSSVLGAFTSYLQSFFSISRVLRTTLLSSIGSAIFAVAAIHSGAPLLIVIVALPLADSLNVALFCSTSGLRLRARFDFRETLLLLRESLPVGITSALVILYFRLDTLFVFKFAGASALGLYSACFRLIEPALMIPSSFSTTAYTLLSSAERSRDSVSHIMQTMWRTMWPAYGLVAGFALTVLLGGKLFLGRLFPMYLPAYPIMTVLSMTLLARSINMGLSAIFNSRGRYSTITRIAAINLGVNVVLVLVLTPRYGALGAAWAAFSTESINTLIQGGTLFSVFRVAKGDLAVGNTNFDIELQK